MSDHGTIQRRRRGSATRCLALLAGAAALILATTSGAYASGAYGKYLSPDQAFQLSVVGTGAGIDLDWHIANGYYLYRDKFRIAARSGAVGGPEFPPAEVEQDPNFGRVPIYRHGVRVVVPWRKVRRGGSVALSVTYQGCATDGLCYPAITKQVEVAAPQGTGNRTNAGAS